jgi:hypothetical protein
MTALRPIPVGTVHDAGLPLALGAVVTYHGRIRSEHHNVFYVAAIEDTGFTIIDREYPSVTTLANVARGSLRPTGEVVVLCHCGHEAGPGRSGATWCEHRAGERYCGCTDHD